MDSESVSITEMPNGNFRVSGLINSITIPRDVMLKFLGEFSEKVLALRIDAMSRALTGQDKVISEATGHVRGCRLDRCSPSCPHAQGGVDYCVDTLCRPGCDGEHG